MLPLAHGAALLRRHRACTLAIAAVIGVVAFVPLRVRSVATEFPNRPLIITASPGVCVPATLPTIASFAEMHRCSRCCPPSRTAGWA